VGLVIDTSVFVDAERKGIRVQEIITRLIEGGPLTISAISLIELAHGIARANSQAIRAERERFVRAVQASFPVIPLNGETAIATGLLDGDLRGRGFTIGVAAAAIAAAALLRGYGVATLNGRHFKLVPGLNVVEM
jgi:tRNA(fMet)-specific endonuclease VapC